MWSLRDLKSSGEWRKYQSAIGLGSTWAVALLGFTLLGYWADRKTGGGHVWMLVGIFAGLSYGAYELWRIIRVWNRSDRPARGGQPTDPGPKN